MMHIEHMAYRHSFKLHRKKSYMMPKVTITLDTETIWVTKFICMLFDEVLDNSLPVTPKNPKSFSTNTLP